MNFTNLDCKNFNKRCLSARTILLIMEGELTILNKHKQLTKWEKARRLGIWNYIYLYGLLMGASVILLIKQFSSIENAMCV